MLLNTVWVQSGFQIHVRSVFWIAPLISLVPNSPLHFSRFLKNHTFPWIYHAQNLSTYQIYFNKCFMTKKFWALFFCYFVGNYFRGWTPFRRWLFRHANEDWKIWIHILAATWQVTNQNASDSSQSVRGIQSLTPRNKFGSGAESEQA
jgi:hypothetical protein